MLKAQSGFEYLFIAGIAVTVIVLVGVALYMLGVFTPEIPISSQSSGIYLTSQIISLDGASIYTDGTLKLLLSAKGTTSITIKRIKVGNESFDENVKLIPGTSKIIYETLSNVGGENEKYKLELQILYTRGELDEMAAGMLIGKYIDRSKTWWNSSFRYRIKITFKENNGVARNGEHIRFNLTLNSERENDSSSVVLMCDGTRVPFEAYPTSTVNGWIRALEGVAEIDFNSNEQKDCYLYYDPGPGMGYYNLSVTGWGVIGQTFDNNCEDNKTLFDIDIGEACGFYRWSALNSSSVSVCGANDDENLNAFCYFKPASTESEDFRLSSDDGSWLDIEGTEIIDNGGCHGTTSVDGSYDVEASKFYSLKVTWDENTGVATLYAYYNNSGTWDIIDTECYPFYGDEWEIEVSVGEEESY